jgi:thiol-disulfide isomerase/thioredoxin
VLGLAIGAVVLVVLVGVVIALAGGAAEETSDVTADEMFGDVSVVGASLPELGSGEDAAIGRAAPELEGERPDGTAERVGGAGEPTLVVFLAHWCPHCQAELPLLVELEAEGAFEGVRLVAVLTGTDPAAPNFPPTAWLDDERWRGDVLLDDRAATAASAYGVAGYPFLVAIDADGEVVARASGELPADELEALAAAARGESGAGAEGALEHVGPLPR